MAEDPNETYRREWEERWARIRALIEKEGDKPFDPYATEIGHCSILWNNIHERLSDMFYSLSGLGILNATKYLNIANLIWREYRSDKAARDMLKQVAIIAMEYRPKALEKIVWVLKKLDALSEDRDAAVHSPYALLIESDTKLSVYADSTRANRLAIKLSKSDLDNALYVLRFKLKEIMDFTNQLLPRLLDPDEHAPWPDTPRLQPPAQKGSHEK